MSLEIFPYVCIDSQWSLSDSVMSAIWLQLEQEGKIEQLFYDGAIRDVTGWLHHLKQPRIFAAVIADMDKGVPVHMAWLTDVADGVAWAHHTAIGKYCRGVWEKYLEYWKTFNLRILLGMTPETNELAVKFLKKICKFTIVGVIPQICNMAYEDRRVGGVISYYLMAKEQEQWAAVEKARVAVAAVR